MFQLTGITSDPDQTFTTALSDGSKVTIRLVYRSRIQKYFVDITWGTWTANSLRVCNVPNILEQWTNVLPFGLLCSVSDGLEPFLANDLVSGRCSLYILEAADILMIENLYAGIST